MTLKEIAMEAAAFAEREYKEGYTDRLSLEKGFYWGVKRGLERKAMEVKEITAEILAKNGFKPFIAWQYVLPMENKEIFVCIAPMEGLPNANGKWLVAIKNGYTDAKINITYAHELQQALALCGVDKKIEV